MDQAGSIVAVAQADSGICLPLYQFTRLLIVCDSLIVVLVIGVAGAKVYQDYKFLCVIIRKSRRTGMESSLCRTKKVRRAER